MKEKHKTQLEKARTEHGKDNVSFDPIFGRITVHLYRKKPRYKKIRELLINILWTIYIFMINQM